MEGCFYEVWYIYGDNKIQSVEKLDNENCIDLYIQAKNRTGEPEIYYLDEEERLSEVGRMVKAILEQDHPELLNKLLWDQMLHWFCDVIEVRATYLVDDILEESKMLVTEAREIALVQLMENPQSQMKLPYVKFEEGGKVLFPCWFMNRKSMVSVLIDDYQPTLYYGLSEILGRLNSFGGWEDETMDDYFDEQKKLTEEKRKRN